MKRIFTLLIGAAVAVGIVKADDVKITYTCNSPVTAEITGTDAANLTVGNYVMGSDLTLKEAKGVNGVRCLRFFPVTAGEYNTPFEGGVRYVSFPVTVTEGMTFKPTKVSCKLSKDGTNDIHYVDVFLLKDGQKAEVATKVDVIRNGGSYGWYSSVDQTLALDAPYAGQFDLVFDLYGKDAGTKGWLIGGIVIEGELQAAGFVDNRADAGLAWDTDKIELKVRDPFTAPVLSNPNNLPISYSSSNSAVAAVDSLGNITITGDNRHLGNAFITAKFDGDDTYKPAKVECMISLLTNEKNVTAIDPALIPVGNLDMEYMWKASANLEANGTVIDDENLNVTNPFKSLVQSYAATYAGHEFTHSVQVRTATQPTADALIGTENGGSSSLVLTPAKDLTLYVFGRRQTTGTGNSDVQDDVENNLITKTTYMGVNPNDGKDIYICDQADIETKLEHENHLGKAEGGDYAFCVGVFPLQAGHTYTMWTYGTTYQLNGLGYRTAAYTGLESIDATTAPAAYYNLQGQRIDAPTTPGIYIIRRGTTVSKTVVK